MQKALAAIKMCAPRVTGPLNTCAIRARRRLRFGLQCAALALVVSACAAPSVETGSAVSLAASKQFACGGALEDSTWALWEQRGLPFLRQQLVANRLQAEGDTYVLYDIQTYFHNLAALAQRCKRPARMREMADALMPVFDMLEPLPGNPSERAWLCRGGRLCSSRNRLVNTEVMLVSAQGLGLMSNLANMMAASDVSAVRNNPFVAATAQVSAVHLLRWGDTKARAGWQRIAQAKPEDVKDGGTGLFFTDMPLWMIAVYANLAGMYAQQPELADALTVAQHQALGGALHDALAFFKTRTTLHVVHHGRLTGALAADIDRGYWRLYADNRYAGYDGATPPAVCIRQPDGSSKAQLNVDARVVPLVSGIGWDFSHARRMVHVLAALERNRQAMQIVFGLTADELPAAGLERAFASQLVGNVWNGDSRQPLFTNYWSGANGWYRVAYDNGTGYCNAGYTPFGLSDSFTTGGYATWARYYPVLGELGRTIYCMAETGNKSDQAFIRQYYSGLLTPSANNRMLTQLMFWPTLIE